MAVLEKHVPAATFPHRFALKGEPLTGAFFWLSAFYAGLLCPSRGLDSRAHDTSLWQRLQAFSHSSRC